MQPLALLPLATYPDAISEKAATNAVAMAHQLGAGIHALAIGVDIPEISNSLSRLLLNLPDMIHQAERDSRARGQALLGQVRAFAERAGVPLTTDHCTSRPAMFGDAAAAASRYFDLSLVACEPGNEAARMIAEGVIFGSGRPAVLVPDSIEPGPIDHVVVAWDGSRVAARAVADAQFIMQRAARISIVTILGEKPIEDAGIGERLVESLRRCGLAARSGTIEAEDGPIGETLQEHAREIGGRLLVMGAYGHSRIRDFVLGGATQGVLGELRMPILLSH
jgi:nucleotide-binding universal stress UspA family protein